MNLNNLKDWKTTLPGLVVALLPVVGPMLGLTSGVITATVALFGAIFAGNVTSSAKL